MLFAISSNDLHVHSKTSKLRFATGGGKKKKENESLEVINVCGERIVRLILQILKFVSGALPIRVGAMDDHRGGRFCEVLYKVALSFHTCFRTGPHPKEGCLSGMRSSDLRRIHNI